VRGLSSLPLRVRLVLLTVVLGATGLVVAGVATRVALERFLVQRVDQQFAPAHGPLLFYLARCDSDPGAQRQIEGVLPPRGYAALVSEDGRMLCSVYFSRHSAPHELRELALDASLGTTSREGYRVQGQTTEELSGGANVRLVIEIPLSDVRSTLTRLTALELLVGAAVLAAVAGAAYLLVRRELRPLLRIEDTAAAIAAGDLSRRVEDADPGTEIGSLGRSLNAMLAQIERAFEERRRSEERLRRVVADASHELRTPLTSVRGFAELFRRGAAERPDDLAVSMRRIEEEAQRMGVLVDDLLQLAQLDQGRPLDVGAVDLAELLGALVADHRMLHPEWPIELDVEPLGAVPGDELRLRQAFGNLLANARSHTPTGTHVHVAVRRNGGSVAIEAADDGPGIAPEHLEKVFEPFFRADPSRARTSGGAGLGLAIAASIVHAHGGRIEAENRDGGGALVRIVLPAAPAGG
jgi:two-component system, OmpR family, sensor kinase